MDPPDGSLCHTSLSSDARVIDGGRGDGVAIPLQLQCDMDILPTLTWGAMARVGHRLARNETATRAQPCLVGAGEHSLHRPSCMVACGGCGDGLRVYHDLDALR